MLPSLAERRLGIAERLENAPRLRDVIRLTYALAEAWMDSYPREPGAATLLNAHIDERCFLPIPVGTCPRA